MAESYAPDEFVGGLRLAKGGDWRRVFLMRAILRLETGLRVARVAHETTGKSPGSRQGNNAQRECGAILKLYIVHGAAE